MTPGTPDWLVGVALDALPAVDPATLVGDVLRGWEPTHADVLVLAMGKAAPGMASAVIAAVDRPVRGAVVAPVSVDVPGLESIVGGHPVPTDGSVRAGRRLLELARGASPGTSVLVLVSGGTSALCEVPIDGISLADVRTLTDRLLRSGAPIEEVNEVRSGLSAFKAGGLGGALSGAGEVRVLALSDVVGSDASVIGSGPTVPRPARPGRIAEIAEARGVDLGSRLARTIRRHAPVATRWYPVEVIGDGTMLAAAAVERAALDGVEARVGFELGGRAAATAAAVVAAAGPGLTAHAGETTVVVDDAIPGGRNQEAALAAASALRSAPASGFLALASDGVDGTTDAAGAVVDGGTWEAIVASGIDPREALVGHRAHDALAPVGALVHTGPTGTNVADLWLVWRD